MTDPGIDPEAVDWRSGLANVSPEKHEAFRSRVFNSIASFRDLRKTLGLTQVDVAHALNMTQANVSKIEARTTPSLDTLKALINGRGKVRVLVELDDGQTFEFAP